MGIRLSRVGHIGVHVSDMDRSIEFYRQALGLKITGRWGPPDFGRPICFMRISDKHHDVVLFELPEDAKKAGVTSIDSRIRKSPGIDHIAFEVTRARTGLWRSTMFVLAASKLSVAPMCTVQRVARGLSAVAGATPSTFSTRTVIGSRSIAG